MTPPPAGVAKPPAGIGAAPSRGVAAPPFAQPAAPAAAPRAAAAADPFSAASAAPPPQQVVRVEFDERLVTDQEVGRRNWGRVLVGAVVVLAVGFGIGWGVGQMLERRALYNRTVQDGQEIYNTVNEASTTVTAAQRHINAIVTAAVGDQGSNTPPHVDYDAIEALRALERPFDATAFTDKNYGAFQPGVVNDLFEYMIKVQELWDQFRVLAAQSLPEARRTELDRTATETAEGASTQYGAVLSLTEDGIIGGSLAFLGPGADETHLMARATRGGPGREFALYTGVEQEITGSPEFVMLIDNGTSRGVLAEQTGAFGRFLLMVREIKQKIDETMEIQGRLITSLGEVARLETL
ncbi:MAG: hypothetical protein AB7S26_38105 [Sandaracinaceae bacterium]